MARKKLTPEDIKIHVDSIYSFLQEEKSYSQILQFNSRFAFLRDILLKKQIISLRKQKNSKNQDKHFFKSNFFVLFPKDYEDILSHYQIKLKNQNDRFFNNFASKKLSEKDEKIFEEVKNKINDSNLSELEKTQHHWIADAFKTDSVSQIIEIKKHKKTIIELENICKLRQSEIESLKDSLNKAGEKITELTKLNKKYITEYSAFINDKLNQIEQLKQELHQQKSQKNQISIIKIFGIPFIKKTTKTIK